MWRNRILDYALHPLFISLVLSVIIISMLPPQSSKYRIESIGKKRAERNSTIFHRDLNGNGLSERIIVYTNQLGKASIMIYKDDGFFLDQFNLESDFLRLNDKNLGVHDWDGNGFMELSIVTRKSNLAQLNIFEPMGPSNSSIRTVVLDSITPYEGTYQIRSPKEPLFYSSHEGTPNLVVSLVSGYSTYPRYIYTVNLEKASVKRSPYLTNSVVIKEIEDIDQDGKLEILVSSNSYDNGQALKFSPRSDASSWIMVLDENLEFEFDPIEIPIPFSSAHSYYWQEDQIITLINNKVDPHFPPKLIQRTNKGNTVDSILLPRDRYILYKQKSPSTSWLVSIDKGAIIRLNDDFTLTERIQVPKFSYVHFQDLTGDDLEEIILVSTIENQLSVYEPDLSNPIHYKLENPKNVPHSIEFEKDVDGFTISLQLGDNIEQLHYSKNRYYWMRFPLYVGIFGLIYLITQLILKGYQLKEAKKRKLETEMAELQLKTIKNQVDPHFVFNAINTISDMTLMNDKLEADQMIAGFSKLMRQTLNSSDKIVHSLKDEIEFVDTYVSFQLVRFKQSFKYLKEIDPSIDLSLNIPKHMIYTYIENAIKHGMNGIEGASLILKTKSKGPNLIIEIENHGKGVRLNGKKHKHSTGNGLKIMDRIIRLFEQRYQKKIKVSITDIYSNSAPMGVCVEIIIPKERSHAKHHN